MSVDTAASQPNGDWFSPKASLLRRVATRATCELAGSLQNLRGNYCREGFGVLMYHRVAEETPGVPAPTINVTPAHFRRQLTGLLDRGFECWPLARLIAASRERQPIGAKVFAITFDDGFENNYRYAWPILRELNLPATIFIATKYLDSDVPFPFDDWSATGSSRVPAESWRAMTTRQCEVLLKDGLIELGAHTHTHERFRGRPQEFRRDMRTCLDTLRERFGIERPTFAFPYGDCDEEMIDATRQLGVACGLSVVQRRVMSGDDEYRWGRFFASGRDSAAVIAAKLSGWYTKVVATGKAALTPWTNKGPAPPRCAGDRLQQAAQGEFPGARKG